MSESKGRPLPALDELDTAPFWQATTRHEFHYPICRKCAAVVWYPRSHCPRCIDGEIQWQVSTGLGEIYSFSIVRQSYHPFFRGQVPYVVAYVDLDEGPRLLTNIVGLDDPQTVRIGAKVRLVWEDHEQVAIPLAELVSEH